jgi:hypothetical protein
VTTSCYRHDFQSDPWAQADDAGRGAQYGHDRNMPIQGSK